MFRAAPPSERKPLAAERASTAGGASSVDRHLTKGPRRYPFRLNFYDKPPIQEVTIEQFETWAIDRLRVLAEIESCQARNRSYPEMKELVQTQMKKYLPLNASTASGLKHGPDIEAERMKDHVSHFVLRLAFCRTEDLRRRFIRAETMLFRLRLETDDATEKDRFLKSLDLEWDPVSSEEKQMHRDALIAANPKAIDKIDTEPYFKVHWTRVLDLIEKRKVFMKAGVAYVPMRDQASLIVAEFSSRLSRDLEMTARALPRLDEDDRILPLLSHLSMGFMAGVSHDPARSGIQGIDGGKITADMVDALVRQHAPMCMRNLHESLHSNGHLRHYGRLQYNLFLKDIGLPVEEALMFWRRSFRSMSDDKFNKEHKYNIRHGYGLEGKRISYPAKSCVNIIMQDQPGPQDNHGCPFRHFSPQNLGTALATQYGLNFAEQSEIMQAVKGGHYHVGCTRLFEITHKKQGVKKGDGVGEGESVSHPNRYFERSWTLTNKGDAEVGKTPDKQITPVKNEKATNDDVPSEEDLDEIMQEAAAAAAAAAEQSEQ